jgi:uncharacterized membrane protein YbaN (DUF454 family)
MNETVPGGMVRNDLLRFAMVSAGLVMVVLGIIGIFLPVMPTTPFLLLAAFLFARSSNRFYTWLITNRYFGSHIRNYREKRGIKLRVKVASISMLWITILLSAFVFVSNLYIRVLLLLIATVVTIHILTVKTFRE